MFANKRAPPQKKTPTKESAVEGVGRNILLKTIL
jgi:hypothetical protein